MKDVSVAKRDSSGSRSRKNGGITKCICAITLLIATLASTTIAAINVTTATPQLQSQFIANTTSQWLGTLSASPFFAGTYSFNMTGANPAYKPPSVSTQLVTLDAITTELTAISTYTYVVGFANGMLYERYNNAGAIGYYLGLCANATNFNLVKIDSTTCYGVLGYMDNWIVSQTSGIAVAP